MSDNFIRKLYELLYGDDDEPNNNTEKLLIKENKIRGDYMLDNETSFPELKKFIDSFTDISEEEYQKYKKGSTSSFTLDDLKINLDDDENDDDSLDDDEEDSFDMFISPIEKLDKTNIYPISQYQAFQIANENQNLKTDYYRNSDKRITYLDFTNCKVKLVTKSKKKYWHIRITAGKVSWVEFDEDNIDEFPEPIFCDGFLIKKDFKKLQCLIDVNTGEYIYYSK